MIGDVLENDFFPFFFFFLLFFFFFNRTCSVLENVFLFLYL